MLSFFFQFFAFQAVRRFFFGWSLDNAWKFEFWLKKSYESFLMKTSPRRGASDNRPIGQAHSNRVEGEKTWYWKKKQQKTEKYGSNVPRIIRNARREINSRQISIRYTYTLTAHAPKKKAWKIYTLILNSNSNTEQGWDRPYRHSGGKGPLRRTYSRV